MAICQPRLGVGLANFIRRSTLGVDLGRSEGTQGKRTVNVRRKVHMQENTLENAQCNGRKIPWWNLQGNERGHGGNKELMGNARCWESARKRGITEQATVADPDLHLRGGGGD